MPYPLLLLTGFGPFPGIADNATAVLVPRLTKAVQARFVGFRVHGEILPTEWDAGPRRLTELLTSLKPAIALHFGVSADAAGFQIEQRGANICRGVSDAAGRMPGAAHVLAEAMTHRLSSLAIVEAVERLRRLAIPAHISQDAGAYLCNAVLYHSLRHANEHAPLTITGFIHIPSRIGNDSADMMSWSMAERGALEIVAVAVEQHSGRCATLTAPASAPPNATSL